MKNILFLISALCLTFSYTSIGVASDTKALSEAEFVFAVQDISLDGNIVNFTIPKNAREVDTKADAVVFSGLYATAEKPAKKCPVVSSYDVKKEVKSYNMMSGKANIKAVFNKADDAKAAFDAECLIIEDRD